MNQKIYNLIILDASGSMYDIENEAIAGVVETIQTIRTAQEEVIEPVLIAFRLIPESSLRVSPFLLGGFIGVPIRIGNRQIGIGRHFGVFRRRENRRFIADNVRRIVLAGFR